MRLPSTPVLLGLAAGGVALGLAATSLAGGGDFKMTGSFRTWSFGRADAIRKLLAAAHLVAIDPVGAPNTYKVLPGKGAGPSALDDVRAMQRRGSLVTTTTNLLESGTAESNPRGVAEVPAAETGNLVFGSEADGIAALPIGI